MPDVEGMTNELHVDGDGEESEGEEKKKTYWESIELGNSIHKKADKVSGNEGH
jgi:hypothetical protein